MAKKQVTFADIAEYTHFSKTTISRYFNHPDSLTLENQEKISQALDTLGYKKNKLAKVLANGKSEFIGIIIPNLYLHYQIEGLIVLSHTLSSKKLASYQIPVIAIEREAEYISSITTDNYMGSLQATSLLIRDKCDILIHINVNVEKTVPAYDRIRAFEETCKEYQVPYDIDLSVSGNSYQEILNVIRRIRIKKKVSFLRMIPMPICFSI